MRNTASPFTNRLLVLQGLLYCVEGGRGRERLPNGSSDGEREGYRGTSSIKNPKTTVMSAEEILMIKEVKSKANSKEWT